MEPLASLESSLFELQRPDAAFDVQTTYLIDPIQCEGLRKIIRNNALNGIVKKETVTCVILTDTQKIRSVITSVAHSPMPCRCPADDFALDHRLQMPYGWQLRDVWLFTKHYLAVSACSD